MLENLTLKQNKLHTNNIKTDLICHICDILKINYHIFLNAVFAKQFFSIINLAHLFLQKGKQKLNKLNYLPTQQGVLRTFCTSHVHSVKSASLRQHGSLFVSLSSNNYLINTNCNSYSLMF